MNIFYQTIKIQHEVFGTLVEENFHDSVQFKLFLKMVNGALVHKNDLSFFNGEDFMVHIPFKYLVDSIILTKIDPVVKNSLSEYHKSKIEALVTK
jgi:hypothetical protein